MAQSAGLLPVRWKKLLEKIKKENGFFPGLKESGCYVGALESLRARRLVKRNNKGMYSLSEAGEAVLEEENGQGVLYKMTQQSAILEDIRAETVKREKLLQQRLRQPRVVGKEGFRNIFIVAKLWNSATPIFPPLGASYVQSPNVGGGYVLLWEDKCFCIDPGLNFLTKFYDRKLTPNDIDTIVVTHDHLDHTRDVEGLLSLLFELYSGRKKGTGGKVVDFLASQGTLTKYKRLLDAGVRYGYLNPIQMRPAQSIMLPNWGDNIAIHVTRAIHQELFGNSPVGLVFELRLRRCIRSFKLAITGDTAWSPELYSGFSGADLLIAHIGTIEKKDSQFLEGHLGLKGLGLLISGVRPKLAIVTEFGEEVGEKRFQLCRTLSKIVDCPVLPGEMETEIRISNPRHRNWKLEGRIGGKPFEPIASFIKEVYSMGGIKEDES